MFNFYFMLLTNIRTYGYRQYMNVENMYIHTRIYKGELL